MTGVLLVNMGGATSRKELKVFLSRMFRDPFVMPYDILDRLILSFIISNTRYKKSWKKYELIGGTPIIKATEKTMSALQNELPDSFKVKIAFSYTSPLIDESLSSFNNEGINDIIIVPLYPQSSNTTTSSVISDANKAAKKFPAMKLKFIHEFYQHESFVKFWAKNIHDHIAKNNYCSPYLLFSAHSIPKKIVEAGDTYPKAIEECAKNIAQKLGFDYECAYQSGMRRGEWIGPDIKERLKLLAESGQEEIILIPISFVNENLETLYDMDKDIIPYCKNELGIKKISRINIAEADPLFIQLLVDIIRNN
jgi:ferrochelatase